MKGFRRAFMVEGLNLERFLQRAGNTGIDLHDVKRTGARRIDAQVDEKVLPRLTDLAQKGGWRFTAGNRVGAGKAVDRLSGRRWLLAAVLMMLLCCTAASRMMWHIRIIDAGVYEPDVRAALTAQGVHVPMLRSAVDPGRIRDMLEWRYPSVAWVEAGWRGSTLEIRLVEGITGDMEADMPGACDVVAARDGVVHHLVTRAGTPVVEPGDVVQQGQVLIRGMERTSGGEERAVAARGSVFARVWDSVSVRTLLSVTETINTGRSHTDQTIVSPWFTLWRLDQTDFAHEDVSVREIPIGGLFWPLSLRTETHYEVDFWSVKTDLQSAIDEGEEAAMQKLRRMTGGEDSLVDNWVNWSIIEDEILLSVATGERLVDIAQQERSSGMAATE